MKPYYEDTKAGIVIWHADCREILSKVSQGDTCIVDPVWPNSVFPNVKDPYRLFAEAAALLVVDRLVVQLQANR